MIEPTWKLENVVDRTEVLMNKLIFKIGRQPDYDLKTDSTVISRNHATISILADGLLYVSDHKSVNGTYVNNKKLVPMEMNLLKNGDTVSFGISMTMFKSKVFKGPYFMYKVVKIEAPTSTSARPESSSSNSSTTSMSINDTNVCNKTINNTSTKDVSVYTTNEDNDFILISDDEDDEFTCSQIFHISTQIKQETNDGVDPYKEIKEELKDLDYCDVNYVPTVLTDDIDHFESTSQLLDILETTIDTSDVDDQNVLNISQGSTEDQTNESKSLPGANSNDKMEPTDSVLELQVVLQKQIQPKYVKPPVIEPHSKKKDSPTVKERKEHSKRKSLDKKPFEPAKKQRRSFSTDCKPLDNAAKKEIQEIRKQKLKEIADAKKPDKSAASPKLAKSTAKVKVSESRGDYLLNDSKLSTSVTNADNENGPVTENTNQGASTKNNKSEDNSPTTLSHNTSRDSLSKNKKSPSKNTPASASASSKSDRTDPRLKKFDDRGKSEIDDKMNTVHVPDSTVSGETDYGFRSDHASLMWLGPSVSHHHTLVPDSTVSEEKSGLIWKLSSSNFQTNSNANRGAALRHYDVDDEICSIVKWNVSWLLEQKNIEMSPPVNGKIPPVQVPLSFHDFNSYKNVMSQLVMLELWQYVFQSTFNGEEERVPMFVNIEHVRQTKHISYLDCKYQLPKDNKNAVPFRQDDYCLIEIRLKDSQNSYLFTGFGFIKTLIRQNFSNVLQFTIAMKFLNRDLTNTHMYVKVIANVGSYLRLFKTIKCLEHSPLTPYILEPEKLISSTPIKGHSVRNTPLLNPIQKEISIQASEMALDNKPSFYLIKGPPGTGKSSVIISVILEILHKAKLKGISPHILVTAPSNAAIDSLILKLNQTRCELQEKERKMIKIVRIGPDSSISELVNRFTLRYQSRKQLIIEKNLRKEYSQVESHMDMDVFLKKHLGQQFQYDMKNTQDKVLLGANLICTTLNSCVSYILNQPTRRGLLKYTCCIVDEATQCNEIEGLLPLQLGIDKFILVGDPQQLPAVICNKDAQQLGFGRSIFSRMYENFSTTRYHGSFPLKVLCDQYRMLPEICDYPNRTFYEGKLRSFPKFHKVIEPALKPYLVFNLTKVDSDDRSDYVNVDECVLICKLLETLRAHVKSSCEYSIGIITPYKAQKDLVTKLIADVKMSSKVAITVNTVDSFQGSENDIIIISCVRNSSNYFLANEQRLNVALTRAKQALYIVGNYALFKQCKPLYDLREDAKRRKLLLDIKDNPRQIPLLQKHIFR